MNVKNIIHLSYWFSRPDMATGSVRTLIVGIFLVLVVVGIIMLIARSRQADQYLRLVFTRGATWAMVIGLGGLAWVAMRQQSIIFLSWRIWIALWLLLAIVWGYSIARYMVVRMPAIRAEKLQREMREKYLPKGKR